MVQLTLQLFAAGFADLVQDTLDRRAVLKERHTFLILSHVHFEAKVLGLQAAFLDHMESQQNKADTSSASAVVVAAAAGIDASAALAAAASAAFQEVVRMMPLYKKVSALLQEVRREQTWDRCPLCCPL